MCGIFGIHRLDGAAVREPVVRKAISVLGHRGPDARGCEVRGPIGLAHTRLAILDLSAAAHQPMASDDGAVWIVYNGEVYNFQELREELRELGFAFRSTSDTEVVLKAYLAWGPRSVERLAGMFAYAIWDERDASLLLARDRLGVKPLYYCHAGATLAFASEMKALLESGEVARDLDPLAFGEYLTLRYATGPRTVFRDIRKFPPAHRMIVRGGRVALERYWDFEFRVGEERPIEEYEDEFLALLKDSVSRCLVSDVPVGAYLSGGMDSTALVGLMRELGHDPIRTFCVGFGSPIDEYADARRVSERFGTHHLECRVEPRDFDLLPTILWHLDEPVADVVVLPMFLLAQAARESVKVVLTGDGGDEIFGGYVHQRSLMRLARMESRLPRWAVRALALAVRATPVKVLDTVLDYPASMGPEGRQRLARILDSPDDPTARYMEFVRLFSALERRAVLAPAVRRELDREVEESWRAQLEANLGRSEWPFFDRLIRQEIDFWLPDYILLRQDRLTMARGIEARVPFLDHRIVEFAARVPVGFKFDGSAKVLLQRAIRDRIYPEMRPVKKPFFMPLTDAFEVPYLRLVEEHLSPDRIRDEGWWDEAFVRDLLARRRTSPLLYDKQIMALVLWQMWARIFGVEAPR